MSNTLSKFASSWTATCSGAFEARVSMTAAAPLYAGASALRLRGAHGADLRDLRFEQWIQDGQGRNVSGDLCGGMRVPAPATAHVGVLVKSGASGPYPWRRPV